MSSMLIIHDGNGSVTQLYSTGRHRCRYGLGRREPLPQRPAGPRKPFMRGPITSSFRMRRDPDAEGVEREETWGGVSPHHPSPTKDLDGERRKLPQRDPGQSPVRKWILCRPTCLKSKSHL